MERVIMKKQIFIQPITNKPQLNRRELRKGVVIPTRTSRIFPEFTPIALSNVGEVILEYMTKNVPDCKIKLHKEYFVGGAYKYWIKVTSPRLKIDLKRDTIWKFSTDELMFCILIVEGAEEDVNLFVKEIIPLIESDTLKRIRMQDDLKDNRLIKKHSNIPIYEW